jgi:hypothetical protein
MIAVTSYIVIWIGGDTRRLQRISKDATMNSIYSRALILALTGLLAVNTGFADEAADKKAAQSAAVNSAETHRELAREANKAAAEQAANALIEETRLDLDIRLIGPTSVKIAGDL